MASPTSGSWIRMGTRSSGTRTVWGDGSVTDSTTITSEEAESFSFGRYSQSTPGFHHTHHKYGLPMNKWTYTCTHTWHWQGNYEQTYPQWLLGSKRSRVYHSDGVFGRNNESTDSFSSTELTVLRNKAVNKCLNRMKDQKANLAEVMATIGQNVSMVANAMSSIGKALSALKHGDMANAAKALGVIPPASSGGFNKAWRRNQSKALANGWLQLQYGWKPLLSDIYGTIQALDQRFKVRVPLQRVSAKESITKDRTVVRTYSNEIQYDTYRCEASVRVILYYAITQPNLKTLSQLGITNPAELAWELLRWSFVIDWLVPVGGYLSAFDASLGCDFAKGCSTTYEKYQYIGTMTGNSANSSGYVMKVNLQARIDRVIVGRETYIAPPLPDIPWAKDPISFEHLANATALLTQLKSKR